MEEDQGREKGRMREKENKGVNRRRKDGMAEWNRGEGWRHMYCN